MAFPRLPAGKARPLHCGAGPGDGNVGLAFTARTAPRSLQRALLTHSVEEKLGLGRGSTRNRMGSGGGKKKWVLELRKEFPHHLGKCSGAGNSVTETNATGCPVRFFPP